MSFTTLISAPELAANIHQPDWVIFDARFDLADTQAGSAAYRKGHIPNAHYVHLDNDLSSPVTTVTGRHPLANLNQLTKKLGLWGVKNTSQVVIYDDASGAIAGRLWWLLRYLGHEKVAVLDGGLQQWQKLDLASTTHLAKSKATTYRPYLNTNNVISAREVENSLARKSICLIDARAAERFQGKHEPIDTIAGHIPKALNRAFNCNLDVQGLFLPAEQLRTQFNQLIANTAATDVVHMCGSGVTACHNLLAMEIAGLSGSKLYAGSWSEWIRNNNRAVET